MRVYSDVVLTVLERAGWYPGRDVFEQLKLPPEKKCFSAAREVYSELGLLKLRYVGRDGPQTIYFDVDDSEVSQDMRAELFGFDSHLDPALLLESEFEANENLERTRIAEQYVGLPCARIGFLDDEFGFDIFVAENNAIYMAHGDEPVFFYRNYIDFLNSKILSPGG